MVALVVRQKWIKPWQTGTLAALQSGSTDPFTPNQGSTLLALQTIWDTTRTPPMPTDSGGLFTVPANGSTHSTDAGVGFWTQVGYQPGVNAVPHKVLPPYVLDGVGGQNGEQNLWIVELIGMPPNIFVRDCQSATRASTATSWSISTSNSAPNIPQAGDVCVAIGMYENSAASVSAGLPDPPSGWNSIGVNQDATNNVPTQASYLVVGSNGQQTITWTTTDAAKTYDSSVILTLGTSLTTMSFTSVPQPTVAKVKGFAAFTCSVTGATGTAHYQWAVNGFPVGEDNPVLFYKPGLNETLSTVTVTVTDNLGAIYSTPVSLRVLRGT